MVAQGPRGQSVLEQRGANRNRPWLLLASAGLDASPLPWTPSCCYLGAPPCLDFWGHFTQGE